MPYKDKEKQNEVGRKYYWKNIEKERLRGRLKHRKNREKYNEKKEEYRKNNLSKYAKKARLYSKNNPEKIKARNMANYHLKYLKKDGYEFHHEDYSKPLVVEVLPKEVHQAILIGGN